MTRGILLLAAALLVTGAAATDAGHCDSKPFTLKKPAAPPPKPAVAPAPAPVPKPAPKPAPAKTAKADSSKFVPGCKQPKG